MRRPRLRRRTAARATHASPSFAEAYGCQGECGLRVIELTEAAWKSAAAGKPVAVPKSKL